MKKIINLLFIISFVNSFAQQYQIKGKVVDNLSNDPVESINVILIKNDSIYNRAITESSGEFIISSEKGIYILKLEQFGEVFLSQNISLDKDLDLGIVSIEQSIALEELIIEASLKKQYADRAVYSFDKETLDKARYAKDLLISLPELQLDPTSRTVNSIKGGKVLFLINGIEATDNQIKSIAPTYVKRVIYYDIPPSRWANRADIVVDIITRNPEIGYSYGAEVYSAFTTGFINGSTYANYTKGNNDFGLEYNISYRDYNNRLSEKTYAYELNEEKYKIKSTNKDHFGYTDQDISLRYTRYLPENYTFQTKFTISPFTSFSNGTGKSIFSIDQKDKNHESVQNLDSKYTNPTLDIYFSKNIGDKNELIFNVVGSHFKTYSNQFNHEWNVANNEDIFNNDMNLEATQTGLVGEVAYNHTFNNGTLRSGYRIENTTVSNDLKNLLGKSHYDVNYLEQYLYTEYSGKWEKLGYRLGIGLTNVYNKSKETTDRDWSPTPIVILSYELANNQSLRFTSTYKANSPWASALSSNIIQLAPNIVKKGNPSLETQHLFRNNFIYSFNSKYVDINANVFYNIVDKYFAQNFVKNYQTAGYALTYENADFSEKGISISGAIKPLGNQFLGLKFWVQPVSMNLKLNNGKKVENNFIQNNFTIYSQYKNFGLYYQFLFPVYQIDGAFLSADENKNHLFAQYQHNNWSLMVGMYWMGMPSEYKSKTMEISLVNNTSHTQIFDNENMFVIGLSYDFSLGKKLKNQKKLNNRTSEAVSF
ncbi:outer membrane beta-barrel protein [Riemerella columbina]|uniref:outer membrane beta-barrel protein n=1 Tax=Riemerella columbina TaxID=103810 RepID=UPI0003792CC1|nr:outer membrane beta-barrel protein [Riemerella columbina]